MRGVARSGPFSTCTVTGPDALDCLTIAFRSSAVTPDARDAGFLHSSGEIAPTSSLRESRKKPSRELLNGHDPMTALVGDVIFVTEVIAH
jgi:hypothetical protein